MLIIGNQPVSENNLKSLLEKALDGRQFNANEGRVVSFQLKAWRQNPEYNGMDTENAPRMMLGPMSCSIPTRYSAPNAPNPQAVGLVDWRYFQGDAVKDKDGNWKSRTPATDDLEFFQGMIRVDVDRMPDLYVFLKMAPYCEGSRYAGTMAPVWFEVDPGKLKRQQYMEAGMEAARVATIWNMDDQKSLSLAMGLKLITASEANDITLVKGALVNYAKSNGAAFDEYQKSEVYILQSQITGLNATGKLIWDAGNSTWAFPDNGGGQRPILGVPREALANKEAYLANYLLNTDIDSLNILRKLAEK